jgi:hypothetical protein
MLVLARRRKDRVDTHSFSTVLIVSRDFAERYRNHTMLGLAYVLITIWKY